MQKDGCSEATIRQLMITIFRENSSQCFSFVRTTKQFHDTDLTDLYALVLKCR